MKEMNIIKYFSESYWWFESITSLEWSFVQWCFSRKPIFEKYYHICCRSTKWFGNSFSCNMHCDISVIYLFILSLTPFCCRVYGAVILAMPFSSQNLLNLLKFYYFLLLDHTDWILQPLFDFPPSSWNLRKFHQLLIYIS